MHWLHPFFSPAEFNFYHIVNLWIYLQKKALLEKPFHIGSECGYNELYAGSLIQAVWLCFKATVCLRVLLNETLLLDQGWSPFSLMKIHPRGWNFRHVCSGIAERYHPVKTMASGLFRCCLNTHWQCICDYVCVQFICPGEKVQDISITGQCSEWSREKRDLNTKHMTAESCERLDHRALTRQKWI